ncbi:hypothetical protein B9Z19DRAFT_1137416 [Tuber borchii]|uniref:Uncharacterized protein n=1 Tax=Tuber borchii TaxID=42251 RepID=A0A2T6ZAP9_TUBBO|nr:hypothetical protein B9Z19DRAFT_1137416 [Tuber borchii]
MRVKFYEHEELRWEPASHDSEWEAEKLEEMGTVDDNHSWAARKEGRTETDNGRISDDDESYKKIQHADIEEEEGSAEEEPKISGEEIVDLESNYERDNLNVAHIEGLAGNRGEVFFLIDSDRERAPPTSSKATLEDTQALGSSFEQIDIRDKGLYVALDKNNEKIFVMFGAWLKLIYEEKIREYVEKAMSWNMQGYASVNPPTIPKYTWHNDYKEWLLSNLHLGHMKKALLPLFKAMGAITRVQRILLAAIDLECWQEYEKILGKWLDHRTCFGTDEQECFTLWACLVNVFTEPYVDGGDVKNGWASMCPLCEF